MPGSGDGHQKAHAARSRMRSVVLDTGAAVCNFEFRLGKYGILTTAKVNSAEITRMKNAQTARSSILPTERRR
jgi:hypothetical protein